MTSITNVIKIHPANPDTKQTYRRTSPEISFVKPDCITKDDDAIMHAPKIMGNGLLSSSHVTNLNINMHTRSDEHVHRIMGNGVIIITLSCLSIRHDG
jgi:hypothetical protein